MAETFTDAARAIFDKKVFVHVATLGADGSPHVTPVWALLEGDEIVINTALGRAKARDLANDSRVALSLTDPDNDYSVIAVRGTVSAFTTEGADEVIDRMAQKYMGVESYPLRQEGEVRVTVRIRPDRIVAQPA